MKKRLFLIFMLTLVIFLTGCGKENKEKLRQNFINDTSSLKGYYMEGVLSITNNDDTYNYDVKVGFKKDDNFKVTLLNKANNYEQIILRNTTGSVKLHFMQYFNALNKKSACYSQKKRILCY